MEHCCRPPLLEPSRSCSHATCHRCPAECCWWAFLSRSHFLPPRFFGSLPLRGPQVARFNPVSPPLPSPFTPLPSSVSCLLSSFPRLPLRLPLTFARRSVEFGECHFFRRRECRVAAVRTRGLDQSLLFSFLPVQRPTDMQRTKHRRALSPVEIIPRRRSRSNRPCSPLPLNT